VDWRILQGMTGDVGFGVVAVALVFAMKINLSYKLAGLRFYSVNMRLCKRSANQHA
jgi:hypothetical protein